MKHLVVIILGFFFSCGGAFAQNNVAKINLSVGVPEVTAFENFTVHGHEISKNCPNTCLKIEQVQKHNEYNEVSLSPIKVNLVSNSKRPIEVNAEFISLKNSMYNFTKDKLRVCPKKAKVSSNLSPAFKPIIKVEPDVISATYEGLIRFTITVL